MSYYSRPNISSPYSNSYYNDFYLTNDFGLPEELITVMKEMDQKVSTKRQVMNNIRNKPVTNNKDKYLSRNLEINSNNPLDSKVFYDMLLAKELTDIKLNVIGGSQFVAHKVILAARSPYFNSYFLRFPQEVVEVVETNSKTFQQYLAFVYSQPINISNWRDAFDLFNYLNFTQTTWPDKDRDVVWNVRVPTVEFIEYIAELGRLFNDAIPNSILEDTAFHLNDLIDLSSLGEEVMSILLNSSEIGITKQNFINYMREQGVDNALLDRL